MTVTILTPTYNRCAKLPKLYESLCAQSNRDFEWLVVDDGSTDNTRDLIGGYEGTAPFTIRYVYKENGGKHTALNQGIGMIDSELTFIVDSDDYLAPDAIEIVLRYHEKFIGKKESEKLCGYSFLRAYSDGRVNVREFPVDEAIDTYRQQRINNNLLGDKAEVYYTDILKKYPFEVFEKERFMPEDAVWMKMSGPYNMVHINKVTYYCDYLEGGLTKTGRKMKVFSPYGMMYRSAVYLNDPDVKFKVKVKMMLLYQVYSVFAQKRDKELKVSKAAVAEKRKRCRHDSKALAAVLWLPAMAIYMKWNRQYA